MQEKTLERLVGRLVLVSLSDGTHLKGDLVAIDNGVAEMHSLENIHYIEINEIKRATTVKEPKKAVKVEGTVKRAF